MYYRDISRVLGFFLLAFSVMLLVPIGVALYYLYGVDPQLHPQQYDIGSFVGSAAICLGMALLFLLFSRGASGQVFWREGLAAVLLIWIIIPGIGALPFFLSGTLKNPHQAYFEAMSGFTTTGASVMFPKRYDPVTGSEIPYERMHTAEPMTTYKFNGTITPVRDRQTGAVILEGVEAVSPELLFWRNFIQWIGGGGIVVLFIAVLPMLGVGGKLLFFTETPGPIKESVTPRLKEAAMQIWVIYVVLTVMQVLALRLTNDKIGWLEAINITFPTIATGGFSTKNASIAGYGSEATEWVVIIFMILGSLNFSLYYNAFRGKFYRFYDPELISYLIWIFLCCAFISWQIVGTPKTSLIGNNEGIYSLHEAIRYGTFQLVSAQTTTGLATANFDLWPYAAQLLMLIVMFLGGMSGSTAGGIKVIRQYILFYTLKNRVESMFRPSSVRAFKMGQRTIDTNVAMTALCFFLTLAFFTVLGWFLLVMDGVGLGSALTAVACFINNVGFAFRMGGPTESFAFLSDFGCFVGSSLMLLGRLEFFAILIILVPAFWQENT